MQKIEHTGTVLPVGHLIKRILLVMKLSVTLVTIFSVHLSAAVYSQEARVSLNVKNVAISEVLKLIQQNTSYRFVYSEDFPDQTAVNVNVKNTAVSAVLRQVLHSTGFTYEVVSDELIVIKDAEDTDVFTVKGVVRERSGQPLPGVNVLIKGTNNGTTTDAAGNYAIDVAGDNDVLVFSFIGFDTYETAINGRTSLDVTLQENLQSLSEVVVIGYGTSTRKELTGSVGKVTSETISQQPVGNPLLALQGRVAGLLVTATSGRPGANTSVQIRGITSINGTEPLYIVDGVPFLSTPLNQFENTGNPPVGNQSPLNSINPDAIESIEVLKDADATAIYGSRGANGVILITTKKGKPSGENIKINANVYAGIGQVGHKLDLLNTGQYLAMRKEAYANDGIDYTLASINAPDLKLWDQNQYTDWQELLIGGTARYTDAQLNLTGGTATNRFNLSSSYRKETTVYPGDMNDTRVSIQAGYDFNTPNNRFGLSFTNSYSNDKNNLTSGDFTNFIFAAPNLAPYDDAGNVNSAGSTTTWLNPLYRLYTPYENKTDNLVSNAVLRYEVIPALNVKVSMGYNQNTMDQFSANYSKSFLPSSTSKPYAYFGNTERKSYVIEPQADYQRIVGPGKLQAMLGATYQRRTISNSYIYGYNYSSEALLHSLSGAANISVYTDNTTDYRYASMFGRVNYNVKGKYIVNGSIRRDGSSRFGPDKRYGTFGAVGAAWLFNEESFVKEALPYLSHGKLRTSYGTVGNDQSVDYAYIAKWNAISYPYQGVASVIPGNMGNPDYSWEKVTKTDIAMELGFLHDKILFTSNYYYNKTGDQLVGYPLPAITGNTSVQYNLPAIIVNKGWEFELNTNNISEKDFHWTSSVNVTLPKNELTEFPGLASSSYVNSYLIGEPANVSRGYTFTGIDPTTGNPTFKDLDNTSTVTYAGDRGALGTIMPKMYGGFQNTWQYKNWQLIVFLQFSKQEGFNYLNNFYNAPGTLSTSVAVNPTVDLLNRWKAAGDETDIPRARTTDSGSAWSNYIASSAVWDDASFIRIKNVYLSYTVPHTLASKLKLQSCVLYVQGQNLYTFTGYKGLDPETKSIFLPQLRMLTAGIQVSL